MRVTTRSLIVLGTVALLIGGVVWMPAAVLHPVLPRDVSCERLVGSVWQGGCVGLGIRGSRSGTLTWSLKLPTSAGFALPAEITWSKADSWLSTRLELRADGAVAIDGLAARIALQTLRNSLPADLLLGPLAALAGSVTTVNLAARLDHAGQLQMSGTVLLSDVRLLRGDLPLGDFAAQFGGDGIPSTTGRIADRGGLFATRGSVRFAPGRRYALTLQAVPRIAIANLNAAAIPAEIVLEGRL